MNPAISVIIPFYNVAQYIEECINSVLTQDMDNVEILLIDDCGSDESMSIASKIKDEYTGDKSIKIMRHTKNRGQAAGRNTGVENAKGDYIFFIDSDDFLIDNSTLSKLYRVITERNADMACANSVMIDNETGEVFKTVDIPYDNGFYPKGSLESRMMIHCTVWNKLIRKRFLTDNDIVFDEGIVWEDNLWSFKVGCFPLSICTLSEVTYNYRYRPLSTMNTLTEKHLYSAVLLPMIANRFTQLHDIEDLRYVKNEIKKMLLGALLKFMLHTSDKDCKELIRHYEKYDFVYRAFGPSFRLPTGLKIWLYKLLLKKKHKRLFTRTNNKIELSTGFWKKFITSK